MLGSTFCLVFGCSAGSDVSVLWVVSSVSVIPTESVGITVPVDVDVIVIVDVDVPVFVFVFVDVDVDVPFWVIAPLANGGEGGVEARDWVEEGVWVEARDGVEAVSGSSCDKS
jgi:hypothetical protein